MIEGIEPEKLCDYVETWQKVNAEIETIHSLASVLALLKHSENDLLRVETYSLAHVFELIDDSALQIHSILDDFIGIAEAKQVLQRARNDKATS